MTLLHLRPSGRRKLSRLSAIDDLDLAVTLEDSVVALSEADHLPTLSLE
jgi:hypothetical protein